MLFAFFSTKQEGEIFLLSFSGPSPDMPLSMVDAQFSGSKYLRNAIMRQQQYS